MAGKFHCVTRKNHKFSSPTNPEVWYSSSCACTVKKNHGNSLESIQNKRKQKGFEAAWEALFEAAALFPPNRKSLFHLALTRCRGWNVCLMEEDCSIWPTWLVQCSTAFDQRSHSHSNELRHLLNRTYKFWTGCVAFLEPRPQFISKRWFLMSFSHQLCK